MPTGLLRRTRPAAPPPPPIGAHVSVAGGLARAFERAAALGCDAIQIFVKNANQWRARPLEKVEAAAFRTAHAAGGVGVGMAHASYLINLAAADQLVRALSLAALADELERCGRLGVAGLVLHPGAHLGAGEEAGLQRAAPPLQQTPGGARGPRSASRPLAGAWSESASILVMPAPPGTPSTSPPAGATSSTRSPAGWVSRRWAASTSTTRCAPMARAAAVTPISARGRSGCRRFGR